MSEQWSALHHGIDPSSVPFLRTWLRFVRALARPLVAVRVPAWAVTAAGVLLAADAVLFADALPWLAALLVLGSVVCDGLDGAVAVLTGRASVFGTRLDHAADRVADCAFAAVIWRCGAPWWTAALAAALSLAHERWRAASGGARLSRITVAERPTRAICAVLAGAAAAVSTASWPATVCAVVWVAAALVGLVQLAATPAR